MYYSKTKFFNFPIRKKDKILHLRNKSNIYFKNEFGFYSNKERVLANVYFKGVSKLSVIDVSTMNDISSTNIIQLANNSHLKYSNDWFNLDKNKLLKVEYTNSTVKYFKLKDDYTFEKFEEIFTIVYIDDDLDFATNLKSILCSKYNLENPTIIIKHFDSILPALGYILSDYVDVVITKDFMKDLSAKNLIKRIRKSKSRIEFIVLSNNSNIPIDNVKFCEPSRIDLLIKKLNSLIN